MVHSVVFIDEVKQVGFKASFKCVSAAYCCARTAKDDAMELIGDT